MDIKKALWERRSIRKFKPQKIPSHVLFEILEAGMQAPSSCNQQMYYFIVIEDDLLKIKLEKEAGFKWINRIPTPVFVITDKRFGNEKFANIQGASATIQNMLLYAYSRNIGSCWIVGYGDKAMVKKLLNIPHHFHILGCIGFGHPDEKPIPPFKRDVKEVTFTNQLALSQKESNNPDDWRYEDIKYLAARTIFAKSPDIGYYHLFPLELEQQFKYLVQHIKNKVLYLNDISGIYLFELAALKPECSFTMVSNSKELNAWMEEKKMFHKARNVRFIYSEDLAVETKTYDTVLCLDQLNRLPKQQRNAFLKIAYDALIPQGTLLVSFLNKNSVYGTLFRNGVGRRYGPEISLSWQYVAQLIQENQFSIVERVGFNLLPSPRLFLKMGVPGKYTFLNTYMRSLARCNFLEKSVSRGTLKIFSTTNIVLAKKE